MSFTSIISIIDKAAGLTTNIGSLTAHINTVKDTMQNVNKIKNDLEVIWSTSKNNLESFKTGNIQPNSNKDKIYVYKKYVY